MAKIHPVKPVTHATGPVYTTNSPTKFSNASKSKMKPAKPIHQATGPIRTVNSTHIPTMSADKAPKGSKSMGEKKWFDPCNTTGGSKDNFGGQPSLPVHYGK